MLRSSSLLRTVKALAVAAMLLVGKPGLTAGTCLTEIEVTSSSDSGAGSLRQALIDICSPGEITFSPDLNGSTIFVNSPLTIDKNGITITGPGADQLTLDGGGETRILEVVAEGSNISGLTFLAGQADFGAGRVVPEIPSDVAGAIFYLGSELQSPPLPPRVGKPSIPHGLQSCVFYENGANNGGAIYNAGLLNIDSCTFVNNSASGDGGAILQSFDSTATPTLTIVNSTFYENQAESDGGAITVAGGDFGIYYSTLTRNVSDSNEGGVGNGALTVSTDGTAAILGCIVAQNIDASPIDQPVKKGAADIMPRGEVSENIPDILDYTENTYFFSYGYNVIGDINGTIIGFEQPTDQFGFGEEPLDAMVQPLGNNGGTVPTCNLDENSPAIDSGNPVSFPPVDQIGIVRPVGAGPDSGSREAPPSCLFDHITVTSIDDAGTGTLRQALIDICPGGVIDFDESLSGSVISLTSGPLLHDTDNVTINGLGADKLTIDGSENTGRIMDVTALGTIINDLAFQNGITQEGNGRLAPGIPGGGAINFYPYDDTVIQPGRSVRGGPSPVGSQINRCSFAGNESSYGGALNVVTPLTIDSSTFTDNKASLGGAIFVSDQFDQLSTPSLAVVNSTFFLNYSDAHGSAIFARGSVDVSIEFSTITNNFADIDQNDFGDGAVYSNIGEGTFTMGSTIVAQNRDQSGTPITKGGRSVPPSVYPDVRDEGTSPIVSTGYNVIGNSDGAAGFVQPTDQTGTTEAPLDAKLGPLAVAGGTMPTVSPLLGSPATDKGDPIGYPATDQNGRTRFLGFGPEVGAVEIAPTIDIALTSSPDGDIPNGATVQSDPGSVGGTSSRAFTIRNDGDTTLTIASVAITGGYTIASNIDGTVLGVGGTVDFVAQATPEAPGPVSGTITIDSDDPDEDPYVVFIETFFCADHITVANAGDNGPGSLREALTLVCPGGLIDFDNDLTGGTITLTSGNLFVDVNDITIQGLGARNLTISGNNESRIFYTQVGTVTINDLKLVDGLTTETLDIRGPGFFNDGLGGAIFVGRDRREEKADDRGLVIFPEGEGLYLNRVQIENCSAMYSGGALYVDDVATIDSCTFVNNFAELGGGAINNFESTFIVNSTFTFNFTNGSGGAIQNENGFVYSEFNTIRENTADEDGDGFGDGGGIATSWEDTRKSEKEIPFILTSIANTIVADNRDFSVSSRNLSKGPPPRNVFPDVYSLSEGLTDSLGGNIIANSAGTNGMTFEASDQVGSEDDPLFVALGILGNNGGPTDTLLPRYDSIAIDAADEETTRSLDQRGVSRPVGKGYDVGSVEYRTLAESISLVGGDNQTTNINTQFPSPLVVRVIDGEGLPATGRDVRFTAPVSGASTTIAGSPAIIGVDAEGLATLTVTANDTIGSYQVIATAEDTDLPEIPFNLTNTAPPIALCQEVTVEAGANCEAAVLASAVDNGSNDPDGGDDVTLSLSPEGPFPLGTTAVTLTVTDDEGDTASCETTVTVVDTTAPVISCPGEPTVGPTAADCTAQVSFNRALATDNCAVTITNDQNDGGADASGTYAAGTHTVTFTATDSSGNTATCSMTFTVNCIVQCSYDQSGYQYEPGELGDVTIQLVVNNDPGADSPIAGATVTFEVISGPNSGIIQQVVTDSNGNATLTLSSNAEGVDVIRTSSSSENISFQCETSLLWQAPFFIDRTFEGDPQGWRYFSPEPFEHPTSSSLGALGITPNDNLNSFGFWLSPLVVTGRTDHSAVPELDDVRGLQDDPFPVITASDVYRVEFQLRSDSNDLATIPTVRMRANTESLQQSDVLVVTASDNGDFSPSTSAQRYPFYICMPQGDNKFSLSFDLLNFDSRDSATTSVFLEYVSIEAIMVDFKNDFREELHQDFTGSQTNGWTGRNAAGFLDIAYTSPDPLGLKISGVPPVEEPGRGNAFTLQYAYWGSPEGAQLVTMDHTRLYLAFFTFESGASEQTKVNVPTFRGRTNSGNMQFATYVLSESMNENCVTPTLDNPITYATYFQTPPELDGQEILFSFDWMWVSVTDNDATIPVYLKSLSVSSIALDEGNAGR
ncbi:HYR domain-containing protein [Candidatus Sumerlaeota bacterium]|nr:HYR domain-containing protein [Candidatus Sumerlaeota bacterium]